MNVSNKGHSIEELLGSKARIRILRILAKKNELNISHIINKTRLNHTNVLKHLEALKNLDIVQEKRFGRIKIYRYKGENLKAQYLKKFIEIWEGDY